MMRTTFSALFLLSVIACGGPEGLEDEEGAALAPPNYSTTMVRFNPGPVAIAPKIAILRIDCCGTGYSAGWTPEPGSWFSNITLKNISTTTQSFRVSLEAAGAESHLDVTLLPGESDSVPLPILGLDLTSTADWSAIHGAGVPAVVKVPLASRSCTLKDGSACNF